MGMSLFLAIQQRSYLIPFRYQRQSLKCTPTASIASANTSLCHQHSQIQQHGTRPVPAKPFCQSERRWPCQGSAECCKTFRIVRKDAFDSCSIINQTNVHMGQAVRKHWMVTRGRQREYDQNRSWMYGCSSDIKCIPTSVPELSEKLLDEHRCLQVN